MKESITTLDKVSEVYNGNSINAEYKRKYFCGLDEGYPFIATKDIAMNGIVDYDNGVKIPYGTKYKIAEPNSVFICAEGGSAGRKIAFIDRKVCFGNKLFCIKPNSESLLGKYVYYYTNSDGFQTQFKKLLAGLIGGVSISKFKSISIPLPPLAEQRKIVDFLDTQFRNIDALKNNAEQQLQAAKDLFQTALASLLTPQNNWETVNVGSLFESYSGGTPSKSHKEYYENASIPWLNSGEICQKYITKTSNFISELGLKHSSAKKYPVNTVLVAMYGATAAQVGILKFEASSNQAVCGLLPNENMLPEFVYYWFLFNKKKFAGMAQGGAQPNLSQVKIKAMPIPKLPLDKQKSICESIDELEQKVQSLQDNYTQTLTLCNDLKQALLKQIFD